MTCPDCGTHKLSAAMWRNKAHELSGTPLPWNPEELLRKEYERGYADAMGWKLHNHLEHLPENKPPIRSWVGLDNDNLVWIYSNSDTIGQAIQNTEAKLKEKNT
jgi:hypothetical protein